LGKGARAREGKEDQAKAMNGTKCKPRERAKGTTKEEAKGKGRAKGVSKAKGRAKGLGRAKGRATREGKAKGRDRVCAGPPTPLGGREVGNPLSGESQQPCTLHHHHHHHHHQHSHLNHTRQQH